MPYGQLEVTVVEVKRIKETDFFDKALPFVCLSLDKQNKQKTRAVQDAGSEATWNEKFQFDIVEGRYELFLEVFDEDVDSDELIGGAIVPLQQVFKQGNADEWFNITRPSGKPIGEIRISMNFENKGPTSGPPGHTPYPVPNGPGYFSPPNSSSSTQGYTGNQVPQEVFSNLGPEGGIVPSGYGSGAPPPIKAPQAFFGNLGPEGGTVPSGYGSGTPPPIKAPQSTGPPAYPVYPAAGGGFPDPSSYINVQPTYGAPPSDYKLPSSEQYHEEQ